MNEEYSHVIEGRVGLSALSGPTANIENVFLYHYLTVWCKLDVQQSKNNVSEIFNEVI